MIFSLSISACLSLSLSVSLVWVTSNKGKFFLTQSYLHFYVCLSLPLTHSQPHPLCYWTHSFDVWDIHWAFLSFTRLGTNTHTNSLSLSLSVYFTSKLTTFKLAAAGLKTWTVFEYWDFERPSSHRAAASSPTSSSSSSLLSSSQ